MKAYIKVVYSSEGMSPAQVEGIFNDHGFQRMNGHQAFETEVADAGDSQVKLEALHPASGTCSHPGSRSRDRPT
jgi:hypothetical protein